MKDIFIWTEIYNCGKIGKIALESFRKYHPDTIVRVYGTEEDCKWINHIPNIIKGHFPGIEHDFKQGHYGTARLWAALITLQKETHFIHFDSDVIFRSECLSDIMASFEKGFHLVGPIRNYKNNPNNRDDVRHLPDLTQTYFFGFNKTKIKPYENTLLTRMCQGVQCPLNTPVIDFFDPVMMDIMRNGGNKIHILNQEDYGSCNDLGQRAVGKWTEENRHMDFGNKICHFSAVGSGMNFYNNGPGNVPMSYVNYSLERYALFCKIFYNETIPNIMLDINKYKAILDVKEWF